MNKIEFCIPNAEHALIASEIFQDMSPLVTVRNTSITNATTATIINPGNSFGEMNGGVDGFINTLLSSHRVDGSYIQNDVKKIINVYYSGELPVGTGILVKTGNIKWPNMIYAPTMRVAEDVSNSINAYLAMKAALTTIMNNKDTLPAVCSLPLMATGAGGMDVRRACRQIREAINVVLNKTLISGDWMIYHQHHKYLKSL